MLPIKTIKNGETTIKFVVDDVYKMLNRILKSMDEMYNDSTELIDSIHKEYEGYEGELIIGVGMSQPCKQDKYDEELGSIIAFKKAKLNSNEKKAKFIRKLLKICLNYYNKLTDEYWTIQDQISDDFDFMLEVNPNFRSNEEIEEIEEEA